MSAENATSMTAPTPKGEEPDTCGLCGDRFDHKRDKRRWCAVREFILKDSQPLLVCTDCFLDLSEPEYLADEPLRAAQSREGSRNDTA